MTTHYLNNTESTWVFEITGDVARVYEITKAGTLSLEADVATKAQAREFYKTAKKWGCVEGSVIPRYCVVNWDHLLEEDENCWEARLALAQG